MTEPRFVTTVGKTKRMSDCMLGIEPIRMQSGPPVAQFDEFS